MKKKLSVALAEDNRFHALLFEQAVRSGYPEARISVFALGRALLDSMPRNNYDLIAVDINLPDISGLELIPMIHSMKADTPIVVITANGSEHVAVEAMKSGAADYISKTGNYDEIIPRVIKQACRKQRLMMKNRRLEAKAREMEKLEAITALVSTLNHEINNPLMAIQGNVELLLEDPDIEGVPVREKLKMIEKSTRRIMDITHQMANLMETSIRHTPAGPMLRLNHKGLYRNNSAQNARLLADKTN